MDQPAVHGHREVVLNALAGGAEAAANRVFAVAEGTPPSVATDVVVLCN